MGAPYLTTLSHIFSAKHQGHNMLFHASLKGVSVGLRSF